MKIKTLTALAAVMLSLAATEVASASCDTLVNCTIETAQARVGEAQAQVQNAAAAAVAAADQAIQNAQETVDSTIGPVLAQASQTIANAQQTVFSTLTPATDLLFATADTVAETVSGIPGRVNRIPADLTANGVVACPIEGRLSRDAPGWSGRVWKLTTTATCVRIDANGAKTQAGANVTWTVREASHQDACRFGLSVTGSIGSRSISMTSGWGPDGTSMPGGWWSDAGNAHWGDTYSALHLIATDRIEGSTPGVSDCDGDLFVDGVVVLLPSYVLY